VHRSIDCPLPVSSFLAGQEHGRSIPFAAFAALYHFVAYWVHSGQKSASALIRQADNDPIATLQSGNSCAAGRPYAAPVKANAMSDEINNLCRAAIN
jgi:hypothetical protein